MASRTRHAHRPECATAFRRAAKSIESWVLSDLGRLSMTSRTGPRTPPILHQQFPQTPTGTPQSPTPSTSWKTSISSSTGSATSFPQSVYPAPSYAPPPTPRGHADWTPYVFPLGHRSRHSSASSATSSVVEDDCEKVIVGVRRRWR
ncbi:hypothetical protein Q9L58_000743 [Maublancomyces gigas]|uniref:Uncharacterized protein n=1 Tax=Discina gigas TaxID=1032678 RepID=A0ABR3GWA1_9PEZI